jgi:hypothetical protein
MHHSSLAGTPTRAKDRREEGRCLHFVTRFEKKNIELEYTDCLPASNPRAHVGVPANVVKILQEQPARSFSRYYK